MRHEYWKNWKDMDNDQSDVRNYFRVKSSLWGQLAYEKKASVYAKLTNEFKAYTYFGGTTTDKSAAKKGYHFDINEVVFDNLYAEVKDVLDRPVDIRLGRQDLLNMYGENFLICDGTPGDGSRTFYFNAAKASWRVNEENTLDVLYINNPRDEEMLPVINRTRLVNYSNRNTNKVVQSLNTTDEEAAVLYWKNKGLIEDLALEAYYIYKVEAEEGGTGLQARQGQINTIGSFAKYAWGAWTLRGQLAGQFGDYGDADRQGVGGYGFVDKDFADLKGKPKATLGYVYLSGDRRRTDRMEAFNPLFNRSPWLSELYNLSMASETGIIGYWTNLQMARTGAAAALTEKLKVSGYYNYLWANEQVAPSAVFSGKGKNRGHLLQSKVEYALTKNISTYFLADYLIPGNFYQDQDHAIFLRTECMIKF
jgi:hypothetical protein